VRFHRKAHHPGRHRAPDQWITDLHEPEAPAAAAAVTAQIPRITTAAEPILPPWMRDAAEAVPFPPRVFRGMVQDATPAPAVHEGLAPAPVPHLPQLREVARTGDTVTFAVTTVRPLPALPPAPPAAALPRRRPRHVPVTALPVHAAAERMRRGLADEISKAVGASIGAAKLRRAFDERGAAMDRRLADLVARHEARIAEHADEAGLTVSQYVHHLDTIEVPA
jgi:hypothetical protein